MFRLMATGDAPGWHLAVLLRRQMLPCSAGPAASGQSVLGLKSQALGDFQWNLDRGRDNSTCYTFAKSELLVNGSYLFGSAVMLTPPLSLCSLQA